MQNKVLIATHAQFGNVAHTMSPAAFAARIDAAREFIIETISYKFDSIILVDKTTGHNFEGLGARLLYNEELSRIPNFAVARRFLFTEAAKLFHEGYEAVVWTEPEKKDLIKSISQIVMPIVVGEADIVLPRRKSLLSYPSWQQPWEETGNKMCGKIFGKDFDFFFGPRALNKKALDCFIEYPTGETVTDKWDGIFSPLLDAQAAGLRFAEVAVDFSYPAQQSQEEENDRSILVRRTHGLDVIVTEFFKRKEYLGNRNQ